MIAPALPIAKYICMLLLLLLLFPSLDSQINNNRLWRLRRHPQLLCMLCGPLWRDPTANWRSLLPCEYSENLKVCAQYNIHIILYYIIQYYTCYFIVSICVLSTNSFAVSLSYVNT